MPTNSTPGKKQKQDPCLILILYRRAQQLQQLRPEQLEQGHQRQPQRQPRREKLPHEPDGIDIEPASRKGHRKSREPVEYTGGVVSLCQGFIGSEGGMGGAKCTRLAGARRGRVGRLAPAFLQSQGEGAEHAHRNFSSNKARFHQQGVKGGEAIASIWSIALAAQLQPAAAFRKGGAGLSTTIRAFP